ncbi:MAG: polyphosphate polymerase domain-containing protein [Desulfobacterales bacterium]|jgi:hypothetical protein|nr:polyphosphate polymerase domain-containing protein [Desulfobacterales bacterium]MDD3864249.1 polyphosphate polymerase domain-containing protein [Eubacteriales bacterium]
MTNTTGRHELKYTINQTDAIQLRARLRRMAEPDEHATGDTGYRVRSLYFDNYQDKALREKIDGINEREKFRLRFYNGDPAWIRLEKKSKKNGISYKRGAAITAEECRRLLLGDLAALWERGDPLLLELYAKMNYQLLRPRSIVDYRREAFIYSMGNVRVTLDTDIRKSGDVRAFLTAGSLPVSLGDARILEVKYDSYLPELIRGLVALSGRERTAFSKYAATRMI